MDNIWAVIALAVVVVGGIFMAWFCLEAIDHLKKKTTTLDEYYDVVARRLTHLETMYEQLGTMLDERFRLLQERIFIVKDTHEDSIEQIKTLNNTILKLSEEIEDIRATQKEFNKNREASGITYSMIADDLTKMDAKIEACCHNREPNSVLELATIPIKKPSWDGLVDKVKELTGALQPVTVSEADVERYERLLSDYEHLEESYERTLKHNDELMAYHCKLVADKRRFMEMHNKMDEEFSAYRECIRDELGADRELEYMHFAEQVYLDDNGLDEESDEEDRLEWDHDTSEEVKEESDGVDFQIKIGEVWFEASDIETALGSEVGNAFLVDKEEDEGMRVNFYPDIDKKEYCIDDVSQVIVDNMNELFATSDDVYHFMKRIATMEELDGPFKKWITEYLYGINLDGEDLLLDEKPSCDVNKFLDADVLRHSVYFNDEL